MAQDRMLRASMRSSEKVNGWPISLRYFWTQLWGYCDDYGRGRRDARLIFADTFPIDEEVNAGVVERWMQALEIARVITVYEVAGKRYFECVNWDEHQELPYFKKTDIPDSSGVVPPTGKRSEVLRKIQENSSRIEGKGREVEVEGKAPSAPTPFCSKHPQGTDKPCRACGNARRAFDAATDAEKHKPTVPGIITDPDCPKHPGRPLHGCDRCAEERKVS